METKPVVLPEGRVQIFPTEIETLEARVLALEKEQGALQEEFDDRLRNLESELDDMQRMWADGR